MTTIVLILFTAALMGILIFGKKHQAEMVIANSMNTILLIALAVAFSLNIHTGGIFYLFIILYFVVPMYGVIALFWSMKNKQVKKQDLSFKA
ncbi:hypothetical protein [Paenibacillus pini]|uniref:Uncharacterized protein n=1 Tax=Paenibacillus pini JCM 16418 TaxID=1236976 RepID=W7YNV4_9BACL|nr:hypothetical protein [Paenibacillus pini]GAF09298.1 hypothetical protein JCM16418_3434 [Paenibacillus pini JCM 16418]